MCIASVSVKIGGRDIDYVTAGLVVCPHVARVEMVHHWLDKRCLSGDSDLH